MSAGDAGDCLDSVVVCQNDVTLRTFFGWLDSELLYIVRNASCRHSMPM